MITNKIVNKLQTIRHFSNSKVSQKLSYFSNQLLFSIVFQRFISKNFFCFTLKAINTKNFTYIFWYSTDRCLTFRQLFRSYSSMD
jgi:hypothetical protein